MYLLVLPATDRLSPIPFVLLMAGVFVIATRNTCMSERTRRTTMLFALGMFVSLAASFYQFIVDDVYISLRYARNLAQGHGLVFNTDGSAAVEGYTNFLWVLLEAPLFLFSLPDNLILHSIRIAGILFGAGVIYYTYQLARLLTNDSRTAILATLFLAAVPEFSFWSVGGLETSMYMFWMMLGLYRFVIEWRRNIPHTWSFVVFFLMALSRPEGLFFAGGVLLLSTLLCIKQWSSDNAAAKKLLINIAFGAAVFGVLYSLYFLWRYNYYGLPFPNTFYAKKIRSAGYFIHRVRQVSDFFVPLFPFFAFATLGYLHLSKQKVKERLLLAGLLLLLIAFCFAARNEWMPGFRYEVPFIPLLMIFFAAGINGAFTYFANTYGAVWKTRLSIFSVLSLLGLFLLYGSRELQKTGNHFTSRLERAHVPLGKWLKKYAPENSSYASWDMGAVPYYSELPHVVDINSEGLLNPHTTFNGYDIDRFLAGDPCFLVLPPDTDYVRPAEIRNFYSHEKVKSEYEFLFSLSFDRNYLLNVYKNKKVALSDSAIVEGRHLSLRSKLEAEQIN